MGRLESEHPSKNDQLPRKDVSYLITFTSTFHWMLAMRQQLHLVTPSSNSRLRPTRQSPRESRISPDHPLILSTRRLRKASRASLPHQPIHSKWNSPRASGVNRPTFSTQFSPSESRGSRWHQPILLTWLHRRAPGRSMLSCPVLRAHAERERTRQLATPELEMTPMTRSIVPSPQQSSAWAWIPRRGRTLR